MSNLSFKVISVLVILFALAGCNFSEIGKYENEAEIGEYIELKKGNLFSLHESGMTVNGQYVISDNEITLDFTVKKFGDFTVKAKYESGVIKDDKGKVWVKNSQLPLLLIAAFSVILTLVGSVFSKKIKNKYLSSASKVCSYVSGIIAIAVLSENALQAREISYYYFCMLIVVIVVYKVFCKFRKKC